MKNRNKIINIILNEIYNWSEEYKCDITNYEADGLLITSGDEKKLANEMADELLKGVKEMSNKMYYVIENYTDIHNNDEEKPSVKIVSESEVWEEIDKAKLDNLPICVYELGKCLIDWT